LDVSGIPAEALFETCSGKTVAAAFDMWTSSRAVRARTRERFDQGGTAGWTTGAAT
jgi:hypothetical protein